MRLIYRALSFYIFNSFVSNIPSHKVRLFYLRKVLKIRIGENTSIGMGCFFAGNQIEIGNNTVINRKVFFDGRVGKIIIGNNVSISQETCIITMTHDVNSVDFSAYSKDVLIGNYCWTGFRAVILPGIIMNDGAVLGVNAVATRDLDNYSVYVGLPAKKIAERNTGLNYTLNYFPYFNSDIAP